MTELLQRMMILAQTPGVEQPVSVTFVPSQIITILIVGVIAGFFASLLIRGRAGLISSLTFGILGAIVGSFIFSALNLTVSPELQGGITLRYIDIIVSFLGAVLLILILFLVFGRRFR